MANQLKFHLDESVPSFTSLAKALRKRRLDVTTVHDVNLYAASDIDHLVYCRLHQRVIYTNDEDYLSLIKHEPNHSGVLYCIQDKYSMGEIIDRIVMFWEVYEQEEFIGRVEFL